MRTLGSERVPGVSATHGHRGDANGALSRLRGAIRVTSMSAGQAAASADVGGMRAARDAG